MISEQMSLDVAVERRARVRPEPESIPDICGECWGSGYIDLWTCWGDYFGRAKCPGCPS